LWQFQGSHAAISLLFLCHFSFSQYNIFMPSRKPVIPHYENLLKAVARRLFKGLLDAQKALEYQRLRTYWLVGGDIRKRAEASGGAIHLGDKLYADISRDLAKTSGLDVSTDTIRRMVQFSKNYPEFPESTTLGFTHYIVLQRVKNARMRGSLEKQAVKHEWSVGRLKQAIQEKMSDMEPAADAECGMPLRTRAIACERGKPYVYRIIADTDLKKTQFFRVDCGFKMDIDIPKDNGYQPQRSGVVYSVKLPNGTYQIRQYKDYKNGPSLLYTYAAVVTNVVDGDTIDARIDVGFSMRLSDRLRLKGINCPELSCAQGRKAKAFVEEYLASCPVVVIRTKKSEMYGRWLADIFALPGCDDPVKIAAEGVYVNQLLLDNGLADVY